MSELARRPGLSVRMKLTLSYAALLLLAGVMLFGVGLLILRFIPEGNLMVVGGGFAPGRGDLITVFVRYSLVSLLGLAIVGLVGGWLLAGRMLRPLTRITDAARRVRDGSLDHRIRMPGRQNELAELADAFDDMLGRMQHSIEEQSRFTANASHELRTPLAVMRTMLEVARADPGGRNTQQVLARLDETNERSIALIEALLALAGIEHHDRIMEPVDIDAVVEQVVDELEASAAQVEVRFELDLAGGAVIGDVALVRQLIANLAQNAVVHNHPGGVVWIATQSTEAGIEVEVSNTGDVLDQTAVDTFTEPFVRGDGRARRADRHVGSGLGLAIVSSIVHLHGASATLIARDGGGLIVRVVFPFHELS